MAIEFEKCKPGKLDPELLSRYLSQYTPTDASIIAGAQVGEDAAVIDMGDRCLVVTTDPITFTTDHIGYYAVHVNVNDVVCLGATPKYFLATILLSAEMKKTEIEPIFAQLGVECKKQNISYIGGHTEVTVGIDRPIVIGQLIAEVEREKLLLKKNIQAGDAIVQINPIPIEGTAIIAMEKYTELQSLFSSEFVDICKKYLFDPGISVRPAAESAIDSACVKAMHDATEGGLATAVYEMAQAANVGCVINKERLLYLTKGKLMCEHFGIDPLGCISSGCLLAAVSQRDVKPFLAYMKRNGYPVAHIGDFIDGPHYILRKEGKDYKLPVFAADEITKIF